MITVFCNINAKAETVAEKAALDRAGGYVGDERRCHVWTYMDPARLQPILASSGPRVTTADVYPQWRWHLDEVFVKVRLCYLWRAVDHEGEVLEAVVTAKRDKAAALKLLKRIMKKYDQPRKIVTDGLRAYSAAMKAIGNSDRQEVGRGLNNRAEKFASAVSTTRARHAAFSKHEDTAKVQLSSRPGPQPFQSGAPSRHPSRLQAQTLCRIGRVACSCGLIEV